MFLMIYDGKYAVYCIFKLQISFYNKFFIFSRILYVKVAFSDYR